jgi:hypothetical protein
VWSSASIVLRTFAPLLLLVLVFACTSAKQEQQSVAQDLRSYVDAIKQWEPKEKVVLAALARVRQSYYADDDFVIRTLRDSLPTVHDLIADVEKFEPATMDVQQLQQKYLQGWRDLESSMQEVVASVQRKDYIALAKAKNQLEDAQAEVFTSYAMLDDMLEMHDASLKSMRKS